MSLASIWEATAPASAFPSLQRDLQVDVAIVGAGVTGLTAARRLAAAGKSVAVLEARRVGEGTTGNSTGNLYSVVGQGLAEIERKWGEPVAGAVVRSRAAAVASVESTVRERGIDCAFTRVPFHQYEPRGAAPGEALDRECDAARRAGLTARIEATAPLPFPTGRCLVIDGQAQLHPLAYVRGLAQGIASPTCGIFEATPVLEVHAREGRIVTARGTVRAPHIVLATHTPKGFDVVQTELGPYREYAIAAEVDAAALPDGVYWSQEASRHSLRALAWKGRHYVIVAGGRHKTGQQDDTEGCLERLERFLREHFAGARVAHRWSAQGYYPADGLPYIGASGVHDNLFLATGFAADGLTYGTLAGELVADAILGRQNEHAALYRARRFDPGKAGAKLVRENANVAAEYIRDYVGLLRAPQLGDLAAGEGRIVEWEGKRCAVHRTQSGELLAVSPACTHLKCIVHWNRAEQSWDCPCHGSRFAPDGSVLEGPALEPLARLAAADDAAAA